MCEWGLETWVFLERRWRIFGECRERSGVWFMFLELVEKQLNEREMGVCRVTRRGERESTCVWLFHGCWVNLLKIAIGSLLKMLFFRRI